MKYGVLLYDTQTDRFDIRFDLTDYYGGLHCGTCLEVKLGGKWIQTRIEKARHWFLEGIDTEDLSGLLVRI